MFARNRRASLPSRIAIVAFAFCTSVGIIRAAEKGYHSHGKRNPFLPPVQATPTEKSGVEVVNTAVMEDWFARNLSGILWDPQAPRALIGDKIVSVGDEMKGCTIVEISAEGIAFQYMGKRVSVPLMAEKKEKTKDGY